MSYLEEYAKNEEEKLKGTKRKGIRDFFLNATPLKK